MLDNPKHEKFAQAIANGISGVQAYKAHVAEPETTIKSCMEKASFLLRDVKIKSRVTELKEVAKRTLEEATGWDKEIAVKYLVEILETPVGELDEFHRLTAELTREEFGETGMRTKLKGISKAEAMKQLSVMCGWNEPEKIQHSQEIHVTIGQ